MTRSSRTVGAARWGGPGALLAATVVLGLAAMWLPARWVEPLRLQVATLLVPGQRVANVLRDAGQACGSRWRAMTAGADEVARLQADLARLRGENVRLAAERNWLAAQAEAERSADGAALLQATAIEARLLGRQARAFLAEQGQLDVGSAAGVRSGALVVDSPEVLLDAGADCGLERDALVVAGGRVWGKIGAVGRRTSTLRPVTDPKYRDLVQLLHRPGQPSSAAVRGVLEGTGEPLCRIRLIPTTEAVAVGDWVYAVPSETGAEVALCYGRVERVEQAPGAAHWDVWMRPAVAGEPRERVAVLALAWNRQRVAATSREEPLDR